MKDEIKIVIGSWGSYTVCNERAAGSSYLTLSRYENWEEIIKELKRQGFELSGIDEELFIQDIEGLPLDCENWDYMSPKELFESLKESGVLDNEYLCSVLCAYLEVRSLREFIKKVETHGNNWNDDIYIYQGYDWEDYGKELFESCARKIDDDLIEFFDFEAYGKAFGMNCAEKYSGGIIEFYD